MKITYYGTSGWQGIPALFCDCDTCKRARKAGGRNIMTRSQSLLTDDDGARLLIDFPCDTYHHVITHELDLENIAHCLITHPHDDHFSPPELTIRGGSTIVPPENIPTFNLYGSDITYERMRHIVENDPLGRYTFTIFEPSNTYDVDGWAVTTIRANHSPSEHSFNYIIERSGKSVLYATDSGYPYHDFFEFIENRDAIPFDMIVLDCTWTNVPKHIDHMNIEDNIDVVKRLSAMGKTHEKTRYFITHFAHFGIIYDEIVDVCTEVYRETGIRLEVAYDSCFAKF